jgi:flavin-dependent dehydrogenase
MHAVSGPDDQPPIAASYDAIVAGAGTAGAAAARSLARAGLRVLVVDARALDGAGAHWVNALPAWMFTRAGIAEPEPPELRTAGPHYVMLDAHGKRHGALPKSPLQFVDMRHLVARLQRDARAAGATLLGGAAVRAVRLEADRPCAVRLSVSDGAGGETSREVAARLFVDASGMAGVLRTRVPLLARETPAPKGADVCAAAQEVRHIADRAGARAFLDRAGARSGDAIGYLGVNGGFSTLLVQIDIERDEVEILTGATALPEFPSGLQMLRDFVAREPWVGERLFGGSGAIPIRRPYERLAVPGLALVGDAACQVFPAHGSGIGAGLIAARLLGEVVRGAADPGSGRVLSRYEAAFQRETGALLAAYDVFRRLAQGLPSAGVRALLASGLLDEVMTAAALDQRLPIPDPARAVRLAVAALRAPQLAARMGPAIVRMLAVHATWKLHPGADERAAAAWRAVARRVAGDP